MILKPFSATLFDNLLADTNYVPLTERDKSRLLETIPEGEEMYLTISDSLYTEWVLAKNQCGFIVITRGVDGSEPRKFPKGSCIFFEASLPVIKWLICDHDCCADGDCPCELASNGGMVLPPAVPNIPWEGTAVFKGDTPMVMGVTGMPSWMKAEQGVNHVRFYGTPTGSGVYNVVASATNCSGRGIATQQGVVTVSVASPASVVTAAVSPAPVVPTEADYAALTQPVNETSAEAFADALQPSVTLGSSSDESTVETPVETPAAKPKKTRKSK